MQLTRYDPFTELRNMEGSLEGLWPSTWPLPLSIDTAPMDMYEEDGKLITKISLPNFTRDEIKVSTEGGILEISAEHTEKQEDETKRRYYMRESSNSFVRRIALPDTADGEEAEATIKDGILTVTMPSNASKEAKLVEVKEGG